jgi:hypothetical protein
MVNADGSKKQAAKQQQAALCQCSFKNKLLEKGI